MYCVRGVQKFRSSDNTIGCAIRVLLYFYSPLLLNFNFLIFNFYFLILNFKFSLPSLLIEVRILKSEEVKHSVKSDRID